MRKNFTKSEAEQIDELVNKAVTAGNKTEAQKYINQLEYIGRDVMGASRNIYYELKAYTQSASGAVRNKEHMVKNAIDTLNKFMIFCVE